MSTGKYSPLCPNSHENYTFFKFNCYGEVPESWNEQVRESGVEYNSVTMFEDYDSEGFDSYGYSSFDLQGNFVGHGNGIDRYGYTESDYLMNSINDGNLYYDLQPYDRLTFFVRNR
jgi:hypothetical protein